MNTQELIAHLEQQAKERKAEHRISDYGRGLNDGIALAYQHVAKVLKESQEVTI